MRFHLLPRAQVARFRVSPPALAIAKLFVRPGHSTKNLGWWIRTGKSPTSCPDPSRAHPGSDLRATPDAASLLLLGKTILQDSSSEAKRLGAAPGFGRIV